MRRSAQERPIAGLAANVASFAALTSGDALSKLALLALPVAQLMAMRAAFLLVMVAPIVIMTVRRGQPILTTRRPGLHLLRSGIQIVSVASFFVALAKLPFTTVVAIMFITPALVALVGVPLLGERLRPNQLAAILLGFVGCLIILRPGGEGEFAYSALAVGSAALWAVGMTLLRLLTRTESHITIIVWNNGLFMLVAGLVALFDWRAVDLRTVALVACMGASQVVGQWLSTTAFRLARAAMVAPAQYTQLLWAAVIAYAFFDEWPAPAVWMGAVLIMAGGAILMRGERAP